MKHLLLAVPAALALNSAQAVEVEGVRFDGTTQVGAGEDIPTARPGAWPGKAS